MLRRSWITGNSTAEERNRVSSFRGFMYKLRRSQNLLAPQWGKRWFTIEGHFVKWYRNEQDLCSAGMVDLKYIRSIHKAENTAYGSHSFIVDCEERSLILRCSTAAEMQQWIRSLHMQADIARGGNGTNMINDIRNRVSTPKHQQKARNPLTFEEELDLHLKTLEELQEKDSASQAKRKKHFDDGEEHDQAEEEKTYKMDVDTEEGSNKRDRKRLNTRQREEGKDDSPAASPKEPRTSTSPKRTATKTTMVSGKKDMKRTDSQDSLDDSYDYDDAVPIRAPGKRVASSTSSSAAEQKSIERVESIEDIELVSTKVSRSKQRLKEHNRKSQGVDYNKENSLRSSRSTGTKAAWN